MKNKLYQISRQNFKAICIGIVGSLGTTREQFQHNDLVCNHEMLSGVRAKFKYSYLCIKL